MRFQQDYRPLGCRECAGATDLGFDFSMAFQPIVNTTTRSVFAHEALVRGLNEEPAGQVFEQVDDTNRYRFDQSCRVKAVKLASELKMPSLLSINFMPNAVYRPELCIRTTLAAAEAYSFPSEQIIFELTESEQLNDLDHIREIIDFYQRCGFKTAIDDFGAGYAGLNLLADIRTDIVKLDMGLIRRVEKDPVRQSIIKATVQVCEDLSTTVIAEGVESYDEMSMLQSFGIELFQGFYFARPRFEGLASVPEERFSAPPP